MGEPLLSLSVAKKGFSGESRRAKTLRARERVEGPEDSGVAGGPALVGVEGGASRVEAVPGVLELVVAFLR